MASEGSLPLCVHALGWFEGRFGYNTHTRNFFDRLSRLQSVTTSPMIGLEGAWEEDRQLLLHVPKLTPHATIALLYGNLMGILDDAPGRRIAYTVWESTKYPDDWIGPLSRADEIWIPSKWGRDVLIDNGLPAERIHVVPEGVDPILFNPDIAPTEALKNFNGFKFLNIGRYEERKGTAKLIKCFDRAFGSNDDAVLVLACDNQHDPDFNIGKILRGLELQHPERIAFIPPVRSHARLAEIYRSCDAFVSPFRAEGWGLPVIEAMACGLPVIATGYSGPTEFLGDTAYSIDFRLTDIDIPYFDASDSNYGQWADPDEDHLIALMREVYAEREAAKRRGLQGSSHVIENFSWDHAAQKAATRLDEAISR